jgi:cell division protein FtsI (penicillin-binding protein 3)
VLLVRLVDLQVVRKDDFVRRARRQQERTIELAPRRGEIRDAEGTPLAVTALADSIYAIPSDITDPRPTAAALAPILRQSAGEILKKISNPERDFAWLARRVPDGVAARIAEKRLPGIRSLKEATRRYPEGRLAASVLGYVGTDNQGLAGLEYRFDDEVRGRPAHVTLLRDAAQRLYSTGGRLVAFDEAGVEGASLTLSLNASLQHMVEHDLSLAAEESRARGASAVVLDPKTGAVLALASWPRFDPNHFADTDAEARRCRPLSDAYEPGSTFKIVAAAAALDTGTVGVDDAIDCGGGTLTIGSNTIHEHGGKAWSALTLGDVLALSSNIGIAHVALGLGRGPFSKAVHVFGFGQKTGIELEGETAGLLADTSGWSALTLPTMSFGQEIGVTVLQMSRAYAAIANGGLLPPLYLVSAIRRPNEEIRRLEHPAPRRVMSEETARILRRLLAHVVEDGTGKPAAIPGYTAAGKTGTAQKAVPGSGYARDRYVASFIGFAPAEAPRAVIAVVIDEPHGKIYGADVAAPVFSTIGSEVLRLLQEPARIPDRSTPPVLSADLAAGAVAATRNVLTSDLVPAAHHIGGAGSPGSEDAGLVPDVTGRGARDAVRVLSQRGLTVKLVGSGFVVSQSPAPGSPLVPGRTCTLILSIDPPVPNAALALREGSREEP